MVFYNNKIENSFSFKILVLIFALAYMLWFGVNFARTTIAFDIISPTEEYIIKDISPDALEYGVYLYTSMSLYSTVGYILALTIFSLLLFITRSTFKRRGWLLIVAILFYLSAPIEIYKVYYDIMLSKSIFLDGITNFFSPEIKLYFVDRFSNVVFNSFSTISFFSHLTAILFLVFKPLDRTQEILAQYEK